jgi:hypothetical protein
MPKPQWVLVAALAVLAAMAAGWWSAGPGSDAATVQAVRVNPPEVDKPGWQAMAAARYLAAHPGQPPKPVVAAKAAPAKPAGPPPLDIAVVFRGDLTALVGSPAAPRLLMASLGPKHLLRRGSLYGEHWRLASLSGEDVVLKRGSEERRISLFGPAQKARPKPVVFVTLPTAKAQRPANAAAASNAAPSDDGANPFPGGFRGGRGFGRGFGGQGFGGGRFGGGRFGGGDQPPQPSPPPPPTPPVVIVPGPSAASTAAPATPPANP